MDKKSIIILCFILLFVNVNCCVCLSYANETIDDVTKVHWVTGSSATVAWESVSEANYYEIVVDVFGENSENLIGTATTGTTGDRIDVQQEIYNIIGNNTDEMFYVSATVYAVKKIDDEIVSKSLGVTTGRYEYSKKNNRIIIKLSTPANLTLSDNYIAEFECDMENSKKIVYSADIDVLFSNGTDVISSNGYSYYTNTDITGNDRIIKWQNNKCIIDLKEQISNLYHDTIGMFDSDTVYVTYRVHLTTNSEGYSESGYSKESNSVKYNEKIRIIPTPEELILTDDYYAEFICNIEKPNEIVYSADIYVLFSNGTDVISSNGYSYYTNITGNDRTIKWKNNTCIVDIQEQISNLYQDTIGMFESDAIYVTYSVHLTTDSEAYSDSGYSKESNSVIFNGITYVRQIDIEPKEAFVCLGKSYYLGKTIEPIDAKYDKIDWSCDDESIVSINGVGLITGVATGTTYVSAKINNVSSRIPITVYEVSSNIQEESVKADIIDVAGDIIDNIANNEEPNLSNTDISNDNIDQIKQDIINGINRGDYFYIDFNYKVFEAAHYSNWNWEALLELLSGYNSDNNWQFGCGYDIEYELHHKDHGGKDYHIGNITEFENEYEFCFDVPDFLINNANSSRNYSLIRFHDNKYDVIPVRVVNGKFYSKSNKYSDFVLMFEENTEESINDNSEENVVINSEVDEISNTESSDSINDSELTNTETEEEMEITSKEVESEITEREYENQNATKDESNIDESVETSDNSLIEYGFLLSVLSLMFVVMTIKKRKH